MKEINVVYLRLNITQKSIISNFPNQLLKTCTFHIIFDAECNRTILNKINVDKFSF